MNALRSFFLCLAKLPPILMLFIILGLSAVVTMLVMGQISEAPSATAGSARTFLESNPPVAWGLLILILTLKFWIHSGPHLKTRRVTDGGKHPSTKRAQQFLGQPITVDLGDVSRTEAWFAVQQLDGMEVSKAYDIHGAHWKLVEADSAAQRATFELYYARTIGVKPDQQKPRTLTCGARVINEGVSTEVELTFSAGSVMDYPTVQSIIAATQAALQEAAAIQKMPVG